MSVATKQARRRRTVRRWFSLVKSVWEICSYRWRGPIDGLETAWKLTFAEDRLPAPLRAVGFGAGPARRLVYFYPGARMIVKWADNICEIRALDLESRGRILGAAILRLLDKTARTLGIDLHVEQSRPEWFDETQQQAPRDGTDDGREL